MENKLQQLAHIIGKTYRAYDEFPDIKVDEEVYLSARQHCFTRMAAEYADVLSRGTVVDQDEERAKSLLIGMLRHIDERNAFDSVIDMHWAWHSDEWKAMDITIYGMIM